MTFSLALLGGLFIFWSQRAPYFVSFDLILTGSHCLLSMVSPGGTDCRYRYWFLLLQVLLQHATFRFKSIIRIYSFSSDLTGLTGPNPFRLSNLESNG